MEQLCERLFSPEDTIDSNASRFNEQIKIYKENYTSITSLTASWTIPIFFFNLLNSSGV